VLKVSVWRRVLGVEEATVVEDVSVVDDDRGEPVIVARVRARRSAKPRCGRCGRVSPRFDRGEGSRRWRALDLGTVRCYLEADAPRVTCVDHGVTVAQVPWARHGAGHTRDFDTTVAWMAVAMAKTTVCALLRIGWATVGSIVNRVVGEQRAKSDPLDGLTRIGIDEVSYKKGHRYLIVVVDHDTGRLVWAAPGRDKKTLRRFFDALGTDRSAKIRLVSADAADWIATVVAERCPKATLCLDAFTSSRGPPTPSMRSAGTPGTRPAEPGCEATPMTSKAPATPSGATPRTSPTARRPSWPGSPKSTVASTAPTC
jgi:transposase